MQNIDQYPLVKDAEGDSLRWYFISQGERSIIKVVDYSLISSVEGRPVYNLAFGDIEEGGFVNDRSRSNNGDIYKIFNTILFTTTLFFDHVPDALVFVSGSDSQEVSELPCRNTCRDKRCKSACRLLHQRINAYSGFVRRNYTALATKYLFLGWPKGKVLDEINPYAFEPFSPQGDYQALMVLQDAKR